MRQVFILFLALFLATPMFAQESDTTQVQPTSKAKETVNKAKDRLVFNFNGGILLNDNDNGFNAKGFQGGFDVYFMYDVVIKKSPISVAAGFGVSLENYTHNSRIEFTDTFTHFVPFADSFNYKKSKLGLVYLDIPLELRYRSKPNAKNMRWKMGVGFKIGLMVRSKWKYRGEEFRGIRNDTGDNIKFKEFGIPNMERLRYGVTARGGYGPFNLHVYYSLSKLFSEENGIRMQPIVVGISINGL